MNGYERMFSSLFFTIAESSQCFFDVGANIGYYSVGSLLINPNMRVVSFEPNPINAKRLTNNFLRNQVLKNYEIYNVAIGEKDSSLTLREPTTVGGAGSTLVDLYSEYRETFEVSLKSLDNSFLDSTCDLIKVDVEGYEKNVVDGAIGFLDKNKPVIFIELLRKWMKPLNHHPNQVLDLLQRTGYVCYAIGETNLTPIDKVHDDTEETNFVFVHAGDSRLKVFEEYTTIKGV
jgi:FkbM family methyltransferase